MPELPEVETIARSLEEPLIGQTIRRVDVDWPRHIATPGIPELKERIQGRTFEAVSRRGKYLIFTLDEGETLLIHLKMSGQLSVVPSEAPSDNHVHTVFALASGDELRFRDIRKFGRVYLVRDPLVVLGKLGPEPLLPSFSAKRFHEMLRKRRRVLKPLLLDQTFIAGIGNIYADEALHHAGLHPQRRSNSLTTAEARSLHAAIQEVLTLAVAREGATIGDYRKPDGGTGSMQEAFAVYGRAGEICYRCGSTVQRIVLAGRSTYFCQTCQS